MWFACVCCLKLDVRWLLLLLLSLVGSFVLCMYLFLVSCLRVVCCCRRCCCYCWWWFLMFALCLCYSLWNKNWGESRGGGLFLRAHLCSMCDDQGEEASRWISILATKPASKHPDGRNFWGAPHPCNLGHQAVAFSDLGIPKLNLHACQQLAGLTILFL